MSTYLTRDFWLVSAGNFFLFLSFYALLPLLPFYLAEEYGADENERFLTQGPTHMKKKHDHVDHASFDIG